MFAIQASADACQPLSMPNMVTEYVGYALQKLSARRWPARNDIRIAEIEAHGR
jgi:hypothetical protein